MKNIRLIIFGFIFFCIITLSCFNQKNTPPFSNEVYLKYNNIKFTIGYTTITTVEGKLGQPETSQIIKFGGEEFYWNNILENTYFQGKLKLLFSIEKGVLIQIIFNPDLEDRFETFKAITKNNDYDSIVNFFTKNKYDFRLLNNNVIWLDFYRNDSQVINVVCGFQFNQDNSLKVLNYYVDSSWLKHTQ